MYRIGVKIYSIFLLIRNDKKKSWNFREDSNCLILLYTFAPLLERHQNYECLYVLIGTYYLKFLHVFLSFLLKKNHGEKWFESLFHEQRRKGLDKPAPVLYWWGRGGGGEFRVGCVWGPWGGITHTHTHTSDYTAFLNVIMWKNERAY